MIFILSCQVYNEHAIGHPYRLWDHLSLNLHLYVQTQEQEVENKDDEIPKELSGGHKSPEVYARRDQTPLEHTSESNTTIRSRNKRDWKGTGRESNRNFPLRSVLTDILHGEEKKLQKSTEIRQPPSSNQRNGRKRDREDEPQQTKVRMENLNRSSAFVNQTCCLQQWP